MVKISISVKYQNISFIAPYRLVDGYSPVLKQIKINELNSILNKILEWTNAERNYTT